MADDRPDLNLMVVTGTQLLARCKVPDEGEILIGRDASCDLVLDDDRVSGRHAKLSRRQGRLAIEDLDSGNGTWVNGQEVTRKDLEDGDEIEIGNVVLRLGGSSVTTVPGLPPSQARGMVLPDRNLLDALAALLKGHDEEDLGTFERMLDALIAAFGADRGVVFTPGKGGDFQVSSIRSANAEVDAERGVSRSIVKQVAETGEPLLLTSAETQEFRQQVETVAEALRSIVAAPIKLPGGSGVVYLDSIFERRAFQDGDKGILLAFTQAAGDVFDRDEETRKLARQKERAAERQRREAAGREIIGESPVMKMVLKDIGKAASADVAVLVTGESGTGKELVARALHQGSARSGAPFVAVNCAAIPADLVESELFGHEKGAFTGADQRRLGQFELADGGTLFLDEIGELPPAAQGKLLRALQERSIQRVGGAKPIPVDFRLVCATNVDLAKAAKDGRFREDLFYRIAVYRIQLPALRERGDDILNIAQYFVKTFAREFKRALKGFDDRARRALLEYEWPGNIRELRNVIEQAVVREDGDVLTSWSILPALGMTPGGLEPDEGPGASGAPGAAAGGMSIDSFSATFEEARKQFEREYLMHQIGLNKGNMKATSEAIGLSRKALYLKCEEYGIDYTAFR